MSVDVHVVQHPAVPNVTEQLMGEPFGSELLRCLWGLTARTGPGADAACTFHVHTAPKLGATTGTMGSQALSSTVLTVERWLTPSPFANPA